MASDVGARLAEVHRDRTVELVVSREAWARCDPGLLSIVLENLLGNAWKFTSKQPFPRVELGFHDDGAVRTFVVRDNGAGFDMAHMASLFGAFQRLHSTDDFDGTGIGLATVRRIVQRHGGRVWAEAQVGQGASFYFTLASP
jgi:light-regulated signal transduction histidine kinase (bacteriophytochrome)